MEKSRLNTHRAINESGLELVKHFEGFSPKVYICPAGFATIGYGHKILAHEKTLEYITHDDAENLLKHDLLHAERAVLRYISAELSDNQFSALVSFTFNLGAAALQRSSLRHKVNYGLYQEGANELLKWVYCAGRKTLGLLRRRIEEQKLFLQ
jgi:lysozyme